MTRKFEIYDITCKSDKLKELRESYIDSLGKPVLYRAISSTPYAFMSKEPIYDFEKVFGDKILYQFGMSPIRKVPSAFINGFINCPIEPDTVKAIRYDGKDYYLYTTSVMGKTGKKYIMEPVLPITREIYEVTNIQYNDFSRVISKEISAYSEYFSVSEEPRDIVSEGLFKDFYKSGLYTEEQYLNIIKNLERREKLVKTLRK